MAYFGRLSYRKSVNREEKACNRVKYQQTTYFMVDP